VTSLQITYLVVLAFCTVASGFFSGSETALIGIGRERVAQLEKQGRRGHRVAQLVSDPDRMLSTLLVANNLVNVLAAAVATTLFIELLGETWGPWVATAAVTAVILVVGEITPKSLATRYPERFSLAVAPTVWQLSRVIQPIARVFTSISKGIFKLFRLPTDSTSLVTEEDIKALAELSHSGGVIEDVEREILEALFTLADRPVRDVMTPRVDIVSLSEPVSMSQVRETVGATGHSRYPISAGELDEMRRVLYVKDLLQFQENPTPDEIERLLRVPMFVPDSASILQVLQDLRKARAAIAVVLDEHGGVDGIVTIKDLVAELVGELQDEYDPGVPTVVRVGNNEWLADGRLPIEDLATVIDCDLPTGPYATIGGLVMALAGRVPAEGEEVVAQNVRFTVVTMDRKRVDRVRVRR
jgi:CBS domain containing-hemolysin-like protein